MELSSMKKLGAYLLFIIVVAVAAGVYGALHDQVSYTISPEYFTKFKFRQFGLLDPAVPARWRAAEIGFLASWWMGMLLAVLGGAAAFFHRTPRIMWRALMQSLVVTAVFVAALGAAGLLYGVFATRVIDLNEYRYWFVPPDVVGLRAFLCAGYLHNATYLGGALAVPVAWLFHFFYRRRVVEAR
jgi:hypothetical protein